MATKTKVKKRLSKPEKITNEELNKIQNFITNINRAQMDLGGIELRKNRIASAVVSIEMQLNSFREEIKKNYGTDDIDIQTGVINYNKDNPNLSILEMQNIISIKDPTYSPLALYFLIDNQLIKDRNEINDLFDILINKTSLEIEIKNLIIYKKALYNADQINENDLLIILKPIINSKSVWKSHALYLVAEYFYSKGEKQKSKEFFSQIITLENANLDILKETQKRLNRDLSE